MKKFVLMALIFVECYSQNIWLTAPDKFDSNEVLHSFYDDLIGGVYGSPFKGFEYSNKNISIFIRFLDVLPGELTVAERSLFSTYEIEYQGTKKRVFEYIIGYPKHEFPPLLDDDENMPEMPQYAEGTSFKVMTPKELACFMKKKNFFFLTGAGISLEGGVHTLSSLYKEIEYVPHAQVDGFVKTALNSPELLVEKILKFYAAARDNPPTPAHNKITELALAKGTQVVTSNFDRLHHRTGILPYRTMGRDVKKDLKEDWLCEVDGIITVGLGRESKHILGSFKKINPNGVIIAINETRPSYIGPNDYLIQGDLQMIIAEVAELYFD